MHHLRKFLLALLTLALVAACTPTTAAVKTEYVLAATVLDGKSVYLGLDGAIEGLVNPALRAQPGEKITVTLVNNSAGPHDIVFPALNVRSDQVTKQGETVSITFAAPKQPGALDYYDSGLERMGMKGLLLVGDALADSAQTASAEAAPVAVSGALVKYTLESGMADGKMVFIGKGGEIDGQINPDLKAQVGDTVKLSLISGDGAAHNFYIDEFGAQSADAIGLGTSIDLEFLVSKEGSFSYYCAIPGHRQAGMEGKFIAEPGSLPISSADTQAVGVSASNQPIATATVQPADPGAVDIVRDPSDLPAPLPQREPEHLTVELETVELVGKLDDGTTYRYWTFNGKVPGPFIRVRVGDTIEVRLRNLPDSMMAHSIDLHAVTGPGGGAVSTQTMPGGETSFTFKALTPGVFVYHCATPMVAHHIANGMYGLILVEPEEGLPPVDHEFYVMQGELYTTQVFGTQGALSEDIDKLLSENPEYFVFNGASMALTSDAHALRAKVGETVRIYFGVGGPNFTSSFHVIGEIFDRVYDQASLTANPLTDVQTTLVPPGGATMVEFKVEVPGRYILVDHALSRMQRGLAGYLIVDGEPNHEIYMGEETPGSGH